MATSFDTVHNINVTQVKDASGNITSSVYRNQAYMVAKMLIRALPYLVFEKFGQPYVLPSNSTRSVSFRRFDPLSNTPVELVEGVTPEGQPLTFSDLKVDLKQYGGLVVLSDVLLDTADSPIMEQATELVGEQAAQVVERLRIDTLLGGSNVDYANGSARSDVNTPMSLGLIRRITRKLKRQLADTITQAIASTPRFYTESVNPTYIAICHPDVEGDIRNIPGFKDAVDYGSRSSFETEIGAVEGVRFLTTTMMPSYPDAGGNKVNAAGDDMLSTGGTKADVYPVLFLAKNAYGLIPLKNAESLTPMVVNPTPTESDPLAQRGTIGWKTMQATVILNQAWMVRAEVAASAY